MGYGEASGVTATRLEILSEPRLCISRSSFQRNYCTLWTEPPVSVSKETSEWQHCNTIKDKLQEYRQQMFVSVRCIMPTLLDNTPRSTVKFVCTLSMYPRITERAETRGCLHTPWVQLFVYFPPNLRPAVCFYATIVWRRWPFVTCYNSLV